MIAFTSASCPISRKYAPTLAGLERDWSARGVTFVFIVCGTADAPERVRDHFARAGLHGRCLLDRGHALAAALDARTTTEVFVLDSAHTLVYRGAVDDQYGLSSALDAPRQRFLVEAIEATLAHDTPRVQATSAPGCVLDVPRADVAAVAEKSRAIAPTYHDRISRIMQANCISCHRAGGVAPFALDTCASVAGRAAMIARVVERGDMPPWFAAPNGHGESPWANDRSLPPGDKEALLSWLRSDRPEGDPAHAPSTPTFDEQGWTLGTPDAVFQVPEPISVKATGTMAYRYERVPTSFDADRWVRGFEVRPTAREVVHHVLVFMVPPGNDTGGPATRLRELADETRGYFAAYVPGNGAVMFPEGFARLLPRGATLVFQLHYTPNGHATSDQTRLGLYFADGPPRHQLRVAGIANRRLKIPAGAPAHEIAARIIVPEDVRVVAFMPHMHVRGKAFEFEAVLGEGGRRALLEVPRYDFNWQLRYELREPLLLPKGTSLRAIGWFDNSDGNPSNPDPSATVRWGPQTTDEMMIGFVEYYLASESADATANPLSGSDGEEAGAARQR